MASALGDAGRQVLTGRDEIVPPRLGVTALTPGELGSDPREPVPGVLFRLLVTGLRILASAALATRRPA